MSKKRPDIKKLEDKAVEIREDILNMLGKAGSGHTGGSLSLVELLLTLYFYEMRHNPENPGWDKRDKFILSKGHGCPALYAVLADAGYFPREWLWTLRKMGSRLQGHPQKDISMGIEASTGSLGQGLSIACGLALSAMLDSNKAVRTYCLMGDGELQEGQVWEAAMMAVHYKLDNLCAIVDWNKLQIDGWVKDVMGIEPLNKKWKAFGWEVFEADGHNFESIMEAFNKARGVKGKPAIILARTVKGKGVSFIENQAGWHGIAPKKDELKRALEELRK
ncbi:MAG: transketolase, partial [Candidatus Omnitrophica bacterium]|nr:transketolase [Candidatus Omnitrophota bacterium]